MYIDAEPERLFKLTKKLNDCSKKYYDGNPEISDFEFDSLLKELKNLETKYPELKEKNSPTDRVGSDLNTKLTEIKHSFPVLSLDKAYNENDLKRFENNFKPFESDPVIVVQPKIDGMSIVLYYTDGKLDYALSRGDGKRGNDITANVKTIKDIPYSINSRGKIAIRGEAVMYKEDFKEIQKENPEFKNARNLVSGLMKRKDSKSIAKYPIHFIAYDYVPLESTQVFNIDSVQMTYLNDNGFNITQTFSMKYSDFQFNLNDYIKTNYISIFPYDADGIVAKLNDLELRNKIGLSNHAPKWAFAWKFDSLEAVTKILDIQYQVGRTGKITPLAILEPVELLGTTVSKASLHNAELLLELGVNIGDDVIVSKHGEIIPQVDGLSKKNSIGVYVPITNCPCCGTKLVKNGVHQFCPNSDSCSEQIIGTLTFFVGKECMDIDTMSESTIIKLIDNFGIKDPFDLYILNFERLYGIEGFGTSRIEKFKEEIEKSKSSPFSKLIKSLGFEGIGNSTAKLLIESGYNSFDKLINAKYEDIIRIKGIGNSLANQITTIFKEKEDVFRKFESIGFKLYEEEEMKFNEMTEMNEGSGELKGKYFGLTGNFDNYKPRKLLIDKIRSLGGQAEEAVSSKTTHLVIGNKPGGSKLSKAEKMGIPVLSEEEFEAMIK